MNLDLCVEGKYSKRAEDLHDLCKMQNECGASTKSKSDFTVTLLKALAVFLGVFLALASLATMRPEMAFISITLILVATGTIVIGSEKIITVFPSGFWRINPYVRIRHHYNPVPSQPQVHIHTSPPPRQQPSFVSTQSPKPTQQQAPFQVPSFVSPSTPKQTPVPAFVSPSKSTMYASELPKSSTTGSGVGLTSGHMSNTATTGSGNNVGLSGGHMSNTATTGSTNSVALGGGHMPNTATTGPANNVGVTGGHMRHEVTSGFPVLPGSGTGRKNR